MLYLGDVDLVFGVGVLLLASCHVLLRSLNLGRHIFISFASGFLWLSFASARLGLYTAIIWLLGQYHMHSFWLRMDGTNIIYKNVRRLSLCTFLDLRAVAAGLVPVNVNHVFIR